MRQALDLLQAAREDLTPPSEADAATYTAPRLTSTQRNAHASAPNRAPSLLRTTPARPEATVVLRCRQFQIAARRLDACVNPNAPNTPDRFIFGSEFSMLDNARFQPRRRMIAPAAVCCKSLLAGTS